MFLPVISKELLDNYNLTVPEFCLLLFKGTSLQDVDSTLDDMWNKGFFCKDVDGLKITYNDKLKLKKILSEASRINQAITVELSQTEDLATELLQIYPDLRTDYGKYYKGNIKDICNALTVFYNVYGMYPRELIIKAVQEYVNNFDEDYNYLMLLKNFIVKLDENSDIKSELASYIESIQDNETQNS